MSTETQTIREGLFRFGQWFSRQNRKFSYYRDPFANFLCKGVIDDAMLKGFDVAKVGTEELLKWNDALQKVLPDHYDEFMQTMYFQQRDGKGLQLMMKKESVLVNFAGAVGQYRLWKNALGKPTKGTFTPQIDGYPGAKLQSLDADEDNFMELIINRREKIGEGMSVLEPLWDVLFAIYMLVSHSAYFIARAGAGLKKSKVPESVLTDVGGSDILTTLARAMTEFGSAADTIIVPETLAGVPVDFDIITVDNPIDFGKILDYYLTVIAFHTGIPQSTLKGLVPGQIASGLVNEASYFDFQQDLQSNYIKYYKWFVNQLNKFYTFTVEEDLEFDILFRVRKVISEEQEIELLTKKLGLAKQWKDLGLTTLRAIHMSKIEGVTEADLREGVDDPPTFLDNKGKPTDEQDDSNDEEKVEDDE